MHRKAHALAGVGRRTRCLPLGGTLPVLPNLDLEASQPPPAAQNAIGQAAPERTRLLATCQLAENSRSANCPLLEAENHPVPPAGHTGHAGLDPAMAADAG